MNSFKGIIYELQSMYYVVLINEQMTFLSFGINFKDIPKIFLWAMYFKTEEIKVNEATTISHPPPQTSRLSAFTLKFLIKKSNIKPSEGENNF